MKLSSSLSMVALLGCFASACSAQTDGPADLTAEEAVKSTKVDATRKALADLKLNAKPLTVRELTASELAATHPSLGPHDITVRGAPGKLATKALVGVKNKHLVPSTLQTTDVTYGKLTSAQFAALSAEHGGKSKIAYDPARAYVASDFLPPTLQAVMNTDLDVPAAVYVAGTKTLATDEERLGDVAVWMTMNCHGTTWEALAAFRREKMDVGLYFADPVRFNLAVTNPDSFTELGRVGSAQTEALVPKLAAGDIVLFFDSDSGDTNLLHSTTFVGGGLVYDKADTEAPDSDFPVRLTTLPASAETVSKAYGKAVTAVAYRAKPASDSSTEAFAYVTPAILAHLKKNRLALPGEAAPLLMGDYYDSNWERLRSADMVAVESRWLKIESGRGVFGGRGKRP